MEDDGVGFGGVFVISGRSGISRRCGGGFQVPCVGGFVVAKTGVVVAAVEVFEDAGEDFGLFVGEVDLSHGFGRAW